MVIAFSFIEVNHFVTFLKLLKDFLPSGDVDVSWPETRTEVDFEAVDLLLTYVHEQLHVKQLSACAYGFVLWFLQAQFYDTAAAMLAKWGAKQSSGGFDASLPLLRDGELDQELERIKVNNGAQSTAVYSLRHQGRLGTREASNVLLPGIFEMLQNVCERCFGSRGEIPHFKMPANEDQPLDLGGVSAEAIIEGFARSNEYLLLQRMAVPSRVIRRSKLLRNHGIYVLASTAVEQLLDIPAEQVDAVAARLCDWAMQAPILPVLCQGRGEIGLNEVLPNWRFVHLARAAQRLALTADDFIERPKETEGLLFGELNWITPTAVATLLEQLPPGNASGEQTKLGAPNLRWVRRPGWPIRTHWLCRSRKMSAGFAPASATSTVAHSCLQEILKILRTGAFSRASF